MLAIFRRRRDRQIMGLELMAISLGLSTFRDMLAHRNVIIYCDNRGAEAWGSEVPSPRVCMPMCGRSQSAGGLLAAWIMLVTVASGHLPIHLLVPMPWSWGGGLGVSRGRLELPSLSHPSPILPHVLHLPPAPPSSPVPPLSGPRR